MKCRLPSSVGLVLLVLLLPAGPLQAQRAAPIEAMNITGLEGDILINGRFRKDKDERENGQVTDTKDFFLREELGLRTSGYFYHPNLVDWSAGGRLGLTQQRIDINDDSFDSDGTITGYDLSALFLKEKPVSLRAYARQSDDFIDRSFAQQIEQDNRIGGAELYYKGTIPMSFLYEKSDLYEESDIRIDDETSELFRYEASDKRDPNLFTQFIYEHEDTDRTATFLSNGQPLTVQDLPDERDELKLTNRWRFPEGDLMHTLFGQTRALRRRGSFNNDLLSANQRLDLQHSDTLSTFYRGQYISDDTDAQKEDFAEGEVGFTKQYYQSLNVAGRVFAIDSQFDNSSQQTIGTFFDADYQKQTPVGRYSSNLGVGSSWEEQESDEGLVTIVNEPVVLASVIPQQLREPNVIPGSVVVTDSNNLVTYIEGIDYRLQQFGQFTEIVRLVTGSILDGELVLVDYDVEAAEDARFQTNRIRWRQRLKLKGTPFALISEYMLRDERLKSGDDPGNLERDEVIIVGLEYQQDSITIVGEYEERDQRLSPDSRSYRVRGTYDQVVSDMMTTTIGADFEKLRYTDADDFDFEPGRDFLNRYGIFGHTTLKLRRDLITRFEASFYDMRGRDDSQLIRVGGTLDYRRGNFDLMISAFHEEYEQEGETGDSDIIRFTLRRSF